MNYKTYDDEQTFSGKLDRLFYLWKRYEGRRTEEWKEFSVLDQNDLREKVRKLAEDDSKFDWNSGTFRE